MFVKVSTHEKLVDESAYYDQIALTHSAEYFPKKTPVLCKPGLYMLALENLEDYTDLGTSYVNNRDLDWHNIIDKVLDIISDIHLMNPSTVGVMNHVTETIDQKIIVCSHYQTKTEDELAKIDHHPRMMLYQNGPIKINSYPHFEAVTAGRINVLCWPLREVEGNLEVMNSLKKHLSIIHGDFCFSNILYNGKGFKFVDPRGSFGGLKGIYGDPRYDYAKLLHSVEGRYEHIIHDAFSVKSSSGNVYPISGQYSESPDLVQYTKDSIIRTLKTKFELSDAEAQKELNRIVLIEGFIFLGMIARHYDSLERQELMYLTGSRLVKLATQPRQ